MDCREAEELTVPYLLGELGPAETEEMSGHAAACPQCMSRIDAESELLVRLSSMEPAPLRVKKKLLARVEADMARHGRRGWLGRLSALGRGLAAHSAPAVAVTLPGGRRPGRRLVQRAPWPSRPACKYSRRGGHGQSRVDRAGRPATVPRPSWPAARGLYKPAGGNWYGRARRAAIAPRRRRRLPCGTPDATAPCRQGLPGMAHQGRRHVQRRHLLRRRCRIRPGTPPADRSTTRPRSDNYHRREVRRQPRTHRTESSLGRHVGNFSPTDAPRVFAHCPRCGNVTSSTWKTLVKKENLA